VVKDSDVGVVVVQICKEGLGSSVGEPGFVSFLAEALFCKGELSDMSVSSCMVLDI
jgi:hypothetical protein